MNPVRASARVAGAVVAFLVFAAAPAAAAVPYIVSIEVGGDARAVRRGIEANALLVELKDVPPETAAELIARANTDLTRIVAVLYENAFYGGTVTIRAAGRPVTEPAAESAIAQAASAGPVTVEIAVDPGPPFVFGRVTYAGLPRGEASLDPARLLIRPGEPAESDVILAEERGIVRQLTEQGYPLARISGREVIADHRTRTLDVTLHIATGRRAALGETRVEGATGVDAAFLERLAPYRPGEPYDARTLERYRDRLRRIPVLASASVRPGDRIDASGAIPVVVEVSERKPRVIGGGAYWSTDEGASVNGYWAHRNLFGRGEELRFEGEIGRVGVADFRDVDLRFATRFTKPGAPTPADDLIASMTLIRESPVAYMRRAAVADVRVRRAVNRNLTVEGGVGFEASRIDYASPATPDASYTLIGIPLLAVYDTADDRLDPSQGYRLSAAGEPISDLNNGGRLFAIVKATGAAYRALDDRRRFVLAGRIAAGSIAGTSLAAIPGNRRFYAGGGGSVRGFAFQSASPRDGLGNVVGGRSLFESSVELRIRINDVLGVVPFVDAGRAFAASFPDFSLPLKVGTGVGLRYLTPIGPIRVDVAVPVNRSPEDPRFGVYVGLGQSF
jgi:translocation and assembly module TamA